MSAASENRGVVSERVWKCETIWQTSLVIELSADKML